MKRIVNGAFVAGATLVALLMLIGCEGEEQGPAEKAGEQIDETVEKAKESAEEATEEAGEAVEKAGDKAKEATD